MEERNWQILLTSGWRFGFSLLPKPAYAVHGSDNCIFATRPIWSRESFRHICFFGHSWRDRNDLLFRSPRIRDFFNSFKKTSFNQFLLQMQKEVFTKSGWILIFMGDALRLVWPSLNEFFSCCDEVWSWGGFELAERIFLFYLWAISSAIEILRILGIRAMEKGESAKFEKTKTSILLWFKVLHFPHYSIPCSWKGTRWIPVWGCFRLGCIFYRRFNLPLCYSISGLRGPKI